jgi:hypothetical protein
MPPPRRGRGLGDGMPPHCRHKNDITYLNDSVCKDSKYNDCLYYCLSNILKENNPFKKQQQLKKYLGIPRLEGVDYRLIPQLEDKLKIPINVSGDFIIQSKLEGLKQINLKLINGHYTIDHSYNRKAFNVSYTPRKIMLFKREKNIRIAYDGVNDLFYNNLTKMII